MHIESFESRIYFSMEEYPPC